jgi:hypothetical protein
VLADRHPPVPGERVSGQRAPGKKTNKQEKKKLTRAGALPRDGGAVRVAAGGGNLHGEFSPLWPRDPSRRRRRQSPRAAAPPVRKKNKQTRKISNVDRRTIEELKPSSIVVLVRVCKALTVDSQEKKKGMRTKRAAGADRVFSFFAEIQAAGPGHCGVLSLRRVIITPSESVFSVCRLSQSVPHILDCPESFFFWRRFGAESFVCFRHRSRHCSRRTIRSKTFFRKRLAECCFYFLLFFRKRLAECCFYFLLF